MNLLLDTHTILWFFQDEPKLSGVAREAMTRSDSRLFFSPAGFWEICLKISLQKLTLAEGWEKIFARQMQTNAIEWLPLNPKHVSGIIDLPWLHKDPFDRLLVAQARAEGLTIVTKDPWIPKYHVKTLW